jgi:hypothetical protein
MDLPIAHQFALKQENGLAEDNIEPAATLNNNQLDEVETAEVHVDPVAHLAKAAGYDDGEKWWEQMFEYRQDDDRCLRQCQKQCWF